MDDQARATLQRLHRAAKGDSWKFALAAPLVAFRVLTGQPLQKALERHLDQAFIPVSPDSGQLLYQLALTSRARTIVEFGTSYGISTIYLAAAAAQTGGVVISSEIEPKKHAKATEHLREAGLIDHVDIRLGDALVTLKAVPDGVDLVLLDGWKDLYQPVLDLLTPRLAPRAIVLADNIHTFKTALRPYVERMQSPTSAFHSVTLPIGEGVEFSVLKSSPKPNP